MSSDINAILAAVGGDQAQHGLSDLLQSQGGVQGLLEQFNKSGLGDAAASWVSTGPNQFLTADQISGVLGSGPIGDFARRLGITPQQAAAAAAVLLPLIISQLTPKGQASEADANLGGLPGGLGDVLGSVLGGGQAGGNAGGLPGGLGDILSTVLGGGQAAPAPSRGGGGGILGSILGSVLGGGRR